MLKQTLGNIKYILKDILDKLKGSDKRVALAIKCQVPMYKK